MRRINYATPRDIPIKPYECDIVEIDIPLIPFILSMLLDRERKPYWSAESATDARHALAESGAKIIMGCAKDIIAEQQRLYRLLEGALYGTTYSVSVGLEPGAEPIYSPPIPLLPPIEFVEPGALLTQRTAMRLLDNLTNATVWPEAPDDRNIRQQLADILAAYETENGLDAEQLAQLVQIVAALV